MNENEVYVIYKDNKPYRTGSKNAVYLNKQQAINTLLQHCKEKARQKWNKDIKYNQNVYEFKFLSKDEQNWLIRQEFKNYSIHIFKESNNKINYEKDYPKGTEPKIENDYDGWNVFKMGNVTECPSCHSTEILGTPNEINGNIISNNICCNCGRVFEEKY
jgi:hypothetical protein